MNVAETFWNVGAAVGISVRYSQVDPGEFPFVEYIIRVPLPRVIPECKLCVEIFFFNFEWRVHFQQSPYFPVAF